MIRHIVFFSAKDKADVPRIVSRLSILNGIPHAHRLEMARCRKLDQFANEIDIVVYGEFRGEADLAVYKAHPLYQEAILHVRPLRDLRFAADFETDAPASAAAV